MIISETNHSDNQRLIELSRWFSQSGKTLGLAESCTGGLVSYLLTTQAGASKYYLGTVVSYADLIKANILDVPKSLMKSMGEVSTPVALAMAQGVRRNLNCDWALSITGIAGPTGGTKEKPVGTVCFAVCGPGVERTTQQYFDLKQRTEIQMKSAHFALDFLWNGIHS